MELDSDTRDLDIQLYNESERLYICDNKIYDSNSIFKNLKTDLDSSTNTLNMATITITKECAKIISISLFKKMFDDYSGKKVGEDFTIEELVDKLEFTNTPQENNIVKEKKEKKKSPKMTGYKIFTQKEKTIITAECKKLKETGQSPKFMAVASTIWKAKTDEEKKVFNDMVNNQ